MPVVTDKERDYEWGGEKRGSGNKVDFSQREPWTLLPSNVIYKLKGVPLIGGALGFGLRG